ncbi:DUF1080 domain-containing protein [Catalinimonas alkaloidigena]|nr:DUF1080 domain-containing protein [Catalinimonas alkaloidigena]
MDPEVTEFWELEPRVVTPGDAQTPPSDAVVLFDGKNLSQWTNASGGAAGWTVADGVMTVKPGAGIIKTKEGFGSCQLHIEWREPANIQGTSQGRGNSGVFLMGLYEVQVLDSYKNRTYSNGQAGSIYKQHVPLVNAMRPPGEWQVYDIIFMAPRFNKEGRCIEQARVTLLHNGVLVQNNVSLMGPTEYKGLPIYKQHEDARPIELQDHGNPVSFRNIWVRPL